MPNPPTAIDQRRVEALREYAIMDTTPEEGFDDISRLTSFICGTPIALITLLDLNRQWFKSRVGLDATEDARFSSNPLVTSNPNIRFYAGAPLVTPQGVPLGTLCAIDRVPRQLTEEQKSALEALARQVIAMLELRRTVKALDQALAGKLAAEAEVDTLRDLLPMCAWCRKVRDDNELWQGLEEYFTEHYTNTRISHGICPACAENFQNEMKARTSRRLS